MAIPRFGVIRVGRLAVRRAAVLLALAGVVGAVVARPAAAEAALPRTPLRPGAPAAPVDTPRTPDLSASLPAAVVAVRADGSLTVRTAAGQENVALLGVAWPGERAGGEEAAARPGDGFLRNLVAGEQLHLLDHEAKQRTDAQGRRLVYAYRAPDGLFVNLEAIRQGYAQVDAEFAYEHLEAFRRFERRAKEAGKGIWSTAPAPAAPGTPPGAPSPPTSPGPGPEPTVPKSPPGLPPREPRPGQPTIPDKPTHFPPDAPGKGEARVFATRSGSKYHRESCRHAIGATPMSLAEAKARGLTPCGVCKPSE